MVVVWILNVGRELMQFLIVLVAALLLGVVSTGGVHYHRELNFSKACVSHLQDTSLRICRHITEYGNTPEEMPFPARCPKNGKPYQYRKVSNAGNTLEDGWGFRVWCPERHFDHYFQAIRLESDLVQSRAPIQTWD